MPDQRLLVFLRAPAIAAQSGATAHYQWRRNRVDLPRADRHCVVLESTTRAHADSEYSVLIDDGANCIERGPEVLASLPTVTSPPWHWPDLAAELRGQPDLFATLFTAFRELCGKAL